MDGVATICSRKIKRCVSRHARLPCRVKYPETCPSRSPFGDGFVCRRFMASMDVWRKSTLRSSVSPAGFRCPDLFHPVFPKISLPSYGHTGGQIRGKQVKRVWEEVVKSRRMRRGENLRSICIACSSPRSRVVTCSKATWCHGRDYATTWKKKFLDVKEEIFGGPCSKLLLPASWPWISNQ